MVGSVQHCWKWLLPNQPTSLFSLLLFQFQAPVTYFIIWDWMKLDYLWTNFKIRQFCSNSNLHVLHSNSQRCDLTLFSSRQRTFFFILSKTMLLKSDNLQYNTLGRWVDGMIVSLTKHLMFQVLFSFLISCRILC